MALHSFCICFLRRGWGWGGAMGDSLVWPEIASIAVGCVSVSSITSQWQQPKATTKRGSPGSTNVWRPRSGRFLPNGSTLSLCQGIPQPLNLPRARRTDHPSNLLGEAVQGETDPSSKLLLLLHATCSKQRRLGVYFQKPKLSCSTFFKKMHSMKVFFFLQPSPHHTKRRLEEAEAGGKPKSKRCAPSSTCWREGASHKAAAVLQARLQTAEAPGGGMRQLLTCVAEGDESQEGQRGLEHSASKADSGAPLMQVRLTPPVCSSVSNGCCYCSAAAAAAAAGDSSLLAGRGAPPPARLYGPDA